MINRERELRRCIVDNIGDCFFHCWENYSEPMICGLTCFLSNELPDNIPFAVCETKVETELEKGRCEGRQELIRELKEMQLGEILNLINSEPI